MKCALVVDDDSRVLSLTQRWLRAAGYEVVAFDNFKDARAEIHVRQPEVLVLDVRLGEFNGIQLGILAKEARSDAHVVIMSSWDDPVLQHEAAQFGATYMSKPFRAAELLEAVRAGVTPSNSPASVPSSDDSRR
jgi:two-component system cell cycle response regulator CpdR